MTGQILSYSIAGSITLACLYLTYLAALRKTTFFGFNRACIMLIYTLATIAPFITFSISGTSVSAPEIFGEPTVSTATETAPAASAIPFISYAVIIYMTGAIICGLRFAADAIYLCYLRFISKPVTVGGTEVLVHNNEHMAPFSWGGHIFMPTSYLGYDYPQLQMIVGHEMSHLQNRHWIDLLISNAFIIVQWYNPAAWLMHAELITVHEYEADRSVVSHTDDPIAYQLLLIKKTAGNRFHAIADSLNHSSLKKRITMMMKNQTKSRARLRALAMLPAMAVALCLINSSCVKDARDSVSNDATTPEAEVSQTVQPETSAAPAEESTPKNEVETTTKVETMAEYPGGIEALYKELTKEIKWENGMKEGRVIVQFTVDATGEMIDPVIIRGLAPENDKCVLEAIKRISTKWTPAKNAEGNAVSIYYSLPVSFKQE